MMKGRKLKLLTIMLVITLLLLSSLICAEELPGTTDAPVGEITTEMTFEQFSKNPTPSNFGLMNIEDQSRFIASINTFQNPNNEQIAVNYFINSNNVNENKETFVKFMDHKGINIDIADGKGVIDFSKEGTLKGSNGETITDIYKFADSQIGIKVDKDGNVILVDNSVSTVKEGKSTSAKNEWSFSGELDAEVSPDGKTILNIKEGTFDGKEVVNGKLNLNDGIVRGTADSVAGVTFSKNENDKLPSFEYNREENRLTTANAKIETINSEVEIAIYGENIKLPNNDLIREGGLVYKNGRPVKVLTSSDVVVQGFNHITRFGSWYEDELDIYYAENDKTLEIDRRENEEIDKIFTDALGKDNKLTYSDMNQIVKEESDKLFELKKKGTDIGKKLERLLLEYSYTNANAKKKAEMFVQIGEYEKEQLEIFESVELAKEELKKVTDKYLPLIIKREEIIKKYKTEREQVYNTEIIPEIKKNQQKDGKDGPISNYFVYGNKKVWLGGQNFDTKVEEGNDIFPEFVKYNEEGVTKTTKGMLEFHPDGGEMEVEKVSRDGQPLALFLDMKGEGKINNGKWEFYTKDNEIKSRTLFDYAEKGNNQGEVKLVSSDMRFKYSTSDGEENVYDLDVDMGYHAALTTDEKQNLLDQNKNLQAKANDLKRQIDELGNDPQAKKEIERIDKELTRINEKLVGINRDGGLRKQYSYQRGQLRRATINPNSDPKVQAKIIKDINNELEKINNQILGLEKQKENIVNTELGGIYHRLINEYSLLEEKRSSNIKKITANLGEKKTGAFGQIITSDNGDAKLSYQEFIEGFSVKKNDYALQYTKEVYRPSQGITVGGEELDAPTIYSSNDDSLDLDILNGAQECIDTQFRLAYEYARETGKDICFDNGRTCLRNREFIDNEEKFIKKWMSTRGTANYARGTNKETANAGSWDNDIQVIPPTHYDQIQPGDVILLNGHAIGIKEVVEIPPGSGKKYFKKFAGSMPAISAHVYDDYVSVDKLRSDSLNGGEDGKIISIYRWRFKGDEVTTYPKKDSAEPRPIPQLEPIAAPTTIPDIGTSDLDELPEIGYPQDDIETPAITDQPTFDLPEGKIEVDPQPGEFSEPGTAPVVPGTLDTPEMPEMQPKDVAATPKDVSTDVQPILPTDITIEPPVISQPETQPLPKLEPIAAPTTIPDIGTSDLDLTEIEFSDDDSIELPAIADQPTFDLPEGKIEVDPQIGDFSEPGTVDSTVPSSPNLPDTPQMQPKDVAATPKEISEPTIPEKLKLPNVEEEEIQLADLQPALQPLLDYQGIDSDYTGDQVLNKDIVDSNLIDPNPTYNDPDIIEPYYPEAKEYTGTELFADKARCPTCSYYIDPETDQFKAFMPSEIITHEGQEYQLYTEFKLTKKQIKHLEKAKKEGKFS